MEFWAIVRKHEANVFFNLAMYIDVFEISTECLVPTKELAEKIIAESLSDAYMPLYVQIIIDARTHEPVWCITAPPTWKKGDRR